MPYLIQIGLNMILLKERTKWSWLMPWEPFFVMIRVVSTSRWLLEHL
jgi:hypothetical protein